MSFHQVGDPGGVPVVERHIVEQGELLAPAAFAATGDYLFLPV
jgi:hypothetical protein